MENIDSIYQKSLKLWPSERLMLIEQIASSLDTPDSEIEKQWAEEAERRYKAFEEGTVQTISLNEIIEKYR
jgi:putative addiction module component (TIGR02574 family)